MMLRKKDWCGKKLLGFITAIIIALVLVLSPLVEILPNGVAQKANAATTTVDEGPTDDMADGAILHAWCWSFNTIRENMADIAEAGYTSVQTSPANTCVVGNGGNLNFTNQWWYHYQPTDYTLGNYQMGTAAEFASMCDVAEDYGIKIIVDVIANHCTSNYNLISSNIKNQSNFFHTNTPITDWSSRYQVTQLSLLGLWDNNTQNTTVQNYIKNYLQTCVSLGADGFRYDAAKHIELPDDGSFAGSFWPNVLNNGAEFQYGEILQDSISRETAYANYMSVTSSTYGKKLRDNIGNNNFSTSVIGNWDNSVSSDKLVTWVESHDNYANAISDYGSSQWMTDQQIKLCWAVIGARAGGTPLFFSRPVGGGGTSSDNRFPEITNIGDRGSSLFMDDEIAAVNKFRNVMVDENEYLRNPNGNSNVLMIERGTKGAVIINTSYSGVALSSTTQLANGSYTNRTDDNSQYTVVNGTITGTLPARSVVVLYDGNSDPDPDPDPEGISFTFEKPASWGSNINAYIYDESSSPVQVAAAWPGVAMTNEGNNRYSYTFTGGYTNPLVIFNDGTNQSPTSQVRGFELVNQGAYTINGLVEAGNSITVYYYTGWTNPYIHYQIGSGSWTSSPGVSMSTSSVSGYKIATIDLGTANTLNACFNNGSGSWDNNSGNNYYFGSAGTYTVNNGTITSGAPN